jgi:hypothetical protein
MRSFTRRAGLVIATVCLLSATTASAAANPPHNVDSARLINYNAGGGGGSTQCAVRYQHGNVYGVGYSKIKRGYDYSQWPASSSSYASAGWRYGWDVSYPNIPDGSPVRCQFMTSYVIVFHNNYLLTYGAPQGTGNGTWLQATGPVYSSIVGSEGWVWGPVYPGGAQAIASQSFPGL